MPNSLPDQLEPGTPYPLGATWDGLGTNFAVFSANAQKIELCLFDTTGRKELARLPLRECTDEIWHGYLPGAHPGTVYGFRAHGPYQPNSGHRFNPHKLLLDPYAKKLVGEFRWSDPLFGYRVHSSRHDMSLDRRDSAPALPKCIVVDDAFDWSLDVRPNVPWPETVIYEAHVKGVSMRRADLRPPERGTFAALCSPPFLDHLRELGITAIELLPVHAFLNERQLVSRGLGNYWGYNTAAFFAPDPAYLCTRRLNEMRIAVLQLHAAGIEVILDVVYNHTCEGNELGPTLSWRGLDNASYYRLIPGDERHYINDTGCGNTLNLSHPRVLQMVMDSLRYWASAYHIDGFRFDLGVTLGREGSGFDPGSGFFDVLRQDPLLSTCKLISEPWDVGPGGYQVGAHPPGFAEWNDKFRDGVRRFWRGDAGMRPDLAARLTGSAELFNRRFRKPWASVNYAGSHDGFTLADLVSYEHKHNEANGEDNRDGHNENWSASWGAEGPTDDAGINEMRARVARSILTSVFTSLGTPMIAAGDEFLRTQHGNNNAYCQDNEISWLDWDQAASPEGRTMTAFTARLIALRQQHPLLREGRFVDGDREVLPGIHDVGWFDERGAALTSEAWQDPERRALMLRRAGPGPAGETEVLLFMLNGAAAPLDFVPPMPHLAWNVLIDSAAPEAPPRMLEADALSVAEHAFVILAARPASGGEPQAAPHAAAEAEPGASAALTDTNVTPST
jgi:glycogen operon protein